MLEEEYFCDGLKRVEKYNCFIGKEEIVIGLRQIWFSDCNIQNKVFTACAIQWASEMFQFTMLDIMEDVYLIFQG